MEFPSSVKGWSKLVLPVLLGGIAGYAYYYYIGCASGTCPISSNPWISTSYGALMGFLIAPRSRKKATQGIQQESTPESDQQK